MELEQLKQLSEIRKYGTISAAAEALHISQPALSRSIRRLEQDLGQELFERTRNHVHFNEAGELALEHADTILGDVRRMRQAFDELSRRQHTLRVSAVAPAPTWRFSALALERDPTTILDPQMATNEEAQRDLINRESSFAITLRPIQLPNVVSHPLMTEDLYLRAPAKSNFAGRTSMMLSELDGQPFIVYEQVGFWMGLVRRHLPHSEIIVQRDRTVFVQLVSSTDLLCFTTDAPENVAMPDGEEKASSSRVSIPIADADAHATFFLSVMADAPAATRAIFDWVCDKVDEDA